MPDPQAQEAPLLHGPGRRVLPEPAGPRLRGGGPDDQAGDRRHRIQGGLTKLCLSPVVGPYNDEVVAYSISRSPNMRMVPEMLAGLEGRLDGEDAPLPHLGMGWQHRMPACRLALEQMGIAQSMSRKGTSTTRRPKASSRWSRPSFTTIGREATPISSREIWRSISIGITTCASRDAWTEAARSSTSSAGPPDSLLLPFRKRGPLHIWGLVQLEASAFQTKSKAEPSLPHRAAHHGPPKSTLQSESHHQQ